MSKLKEILQSGIAPGISTGTPSADPESVFVKAPRAIKQLESESIYPHGPARGASRISKHWGMPKDFIRKVWTETNSKAFSWLIWAFLLLWSMTLNAGQLVGGTTFTDGMTVHAADLNALVGNATITTAFYSGQPIENAPANSDYLLLYSPSLAEFVKITAGNFLFTSTNLFVGLSQKNTINNSGDVLLAYESSTAALAAWNANSLIGQNIFTNSANTNLLFSTNISEGALLLLSQSNTNAETTVSNIQNSYANLASRGRITNYDIIPILSSSDNTNYVPKQTTVSNLYASLPLVSGWTNTDVMMVFSTTTNAANPSGTSNFVAGISLGQIVPRTIVYSNLLVTNGVILQVFNDYSNWIPTTVRAVLVCTNGNGGFSTNDEIPVEDFGSLYNILNCVWSGFNYGAGPTNVWLSGVIGSTLYVNPKAGGSVPGTPPTTSKTNFSAKVYVTYLPIGQD